MPRTLPHLQREVTRHGKVIWYVRVDRGPRIRLRKEHGTKEFFAEYNHALTTGAPLASEPIARKSGTMGWLIGEYMESGAWGRLARETRKQLSYQFKRIEENSGKELYAHITQAHVIKGRDRRQSKPTDANKFLKAMRKLFVFAIAQGHTKRNPTDGMAFLQLPNKEIGFHTWTGEEIEAFEDRWPIGTRERLALDIFLYTGLRRGDAVQLGRQHVKDGIATIRASKNGETITIPVLPPLVRSIEATKTGDLTFLVTTRGKPFEKATFGIWFKRACVAAGVPGSAHGLRKAGASRVAEAGASESQLNALFGWREGSRESAVYTRKARRAVLAKKSAKLLMLPKKSSRTSKKVRES